VFKLRREGHAADRRLRFHQPEPPGQRRQGRRRGFEIDAQAIIARDWRTTLGLSYNDTKIKDPNLFVRRSNASFQFLQANTGCTVLDLAARWPVRSASAQPAAACAQVGRELDAEVQHRAGRRRTQRADRLGLHKDRYNMFLYEAVEYKAKSALEGGLRVAYAWGNGRYEVAAYCATSPTTARSSPRSTSTT
jgi:iron complex outermembrane receptor protein